jgi:hypothetical protein
MSTTVSVDVYARDRASKTFDKVGASAHHSSGLIGKFGTTVAGVFTGAALYNGARDLVHVLGEMAQGAAEDETAARRMALQFKTSANATNAQVAATEDWITAQGKALGVADDDLRPALTKLVAVTHNVKDAQKDVSLALDASASTGKDFSSVVDAMVKAENGSVGGLGRLGVATKDAEGKTKDLNAIQQDMAKTFKGQASAAANTTAGEYARLKVQISETGEAIGYKLLPLGVKFGDWALNEGLPALQQFGGYLSDQLGPTVRDMEHWFKANEDELKTFAKTVGVDVVNGLRATVDIGGKAVDLFMELPEPLRKIAIEAGLAAVVVPKLSMAIQGVTSAVGLSSGQLAGWRKALVVTAGVAGIGAIEEGARTGSKSVSILGDALTGAFVGGSLGSAIPLIGTGIGAVAGAAAGAGAGLIQMQKAADKAGDSSKNATHDVDGLAASLNQLTGATTGATRAQILHDLEQSHAIEAGATLGLTTRDLINATLGQGAAYRKVREAVRDATLSSNQYMDSQGRLHRSNEAAYNAAALLTDQVDGLSTSLGDARRATQQAAIDAEDLSGVYKAFPRTVATQIDAVGIVPTARGVAQLAAQYDATPKQIRTLIQATGTDISITRVQNLINTMNALHDKTVNINVKTNHIGGVTSSAGGHSSGGGSDPTVPRTASRGSGGSSSYFGLGQNPMSHMGAALLASLVSGIRSGQKPLDRVLDAIHSDVQTKLDFRDSLVAAKDQFAASFKDWQTSIFATAGVEDQPVTLDQIMNASAAQLAKSQQVNADVQKLIAMGLSDNLIQQMQANGAQGEDAIHALASASADQIAQLNAENMQTQKNLSDAGVAAASKVYDAQISAANQTLALAQGVAAVVDQLKAWGDKVRFELDGDVLVAALVKEKKNKGKQN